MLNNCVIVRPFRKLAPGFHLEMSNTNELYIPQFTDRNVEASTLYFITETFRYSFIQCHPSVENLGSVTSLPNIASMFGHLWIH